MPTLLVQLDSAAKGTGIHFSKIADRRAAGSRAAPPPAPPRGERRWPAPATRRRRPGRALPAAARPPTTPRQSPTRRSAAAEQSGVDPADAQTSTSTGQGLPVGGGAATPADPRRGALSGRARTVPLELEFVGDFFNLADFFHDVKRFVRVAATNVDVGGRLITIESVNYSSDQPVFPKLKAELKATIYLSPKVRGRDRRREPAGPAHDDARQLAQRAPDPAPTAPTPTAVATP